MALLMLVAGVAATAGLFNFYRSDVVQAQSDRATDEALAAAKAALIGYAASRGGLTGSARPGELPCPDTDEPGNAGYGVENAPCSTAATLIGRLPWKTLGIPEPKDSAGETLWYALSGPFRDAVSNPATGGTPGPTERINSDTRGDITVLAADGVTALTSEAVAVVFAPGAAINGQNRGTALNNVVCALLNVVVVPQRCALNYLDSAAGTRNGASGTGPFIAGAPSATFNDRLLYIDTAEFIPVIEMRVANEIKRLLAEYRLNSDCECYPWADTWDYSGGIADFGQNRGRFPTTPIPHPWGAVMTNGTIPRIPDWIGANNWHNLVWYSVSRNGSQNAGASCKTCSTLSTLHIGTLERASALFLMPGTPPDNLPRLPATSTAPAPGTPAQIRADDITVYLDDGVNRTGATCPQIRPEPGPNDSPWTPPTPILPSCDRYAAPGSTLRDRDRLHVLGGASIASCQTRGQELAAAAPCGTGWRIDNPTCQQLMPTLDACSCADAAKTLARPPCTNTTNPGRCQAALAQLRACTVAP